MDNGDTNKESVELQNGTSGNGVPTCLPEGAEHVLLAREKFETSNDNFSKLQETLIKYKRAFSTGAEDILLFIL